AHAARGGRAARDGGRRARTRRARDGRRRARHAAARAARRDRVAALPRVHAGRDRRPARAAARHRQLAAAPRPRRAGPCAGGRAVNDFGAKLREVAVPGEDEARAGTWRVVEAAFAERDPVRRTRRPWRAVLVATAVL